jgi:predicted transcriptional regulator
MYKNLCISYHYSNLNILLAKEAIMSQEDVLNFTEISQVFGSAKRAMLLFFVNERPSGYADIEKRFKNIEMKISSSEIYKHLDILLQYKYIAKHGRTYVITLKGRKLVEVLGEVIRTPATVPKLELVF